MLRRRGRRLDVRAPAPGSPTQPCGLGQFHTPPSLSFPTCRRRTPGSRALRWCDREARAQSSREREGCRTGQGPLGNTCPETAVSNGYALGAGGGRAPARGPLASSAERSLSAGPPRASHPCDPLVRGSRLSCIAEVGASPGLRDQGKEWDLAQQALRRSSRREGCLRGPPALGLGFEGAPGHAGGSASGHPYFTRLRAGARPRTAAGPQTHGPEPGRCWKVPPGCSLSRMRAPLGQVLRK